MHLDADLPLFARIQLPDAVVSREIVRPSPRNSNYPTCDECGNDKTFHQVKFDNKTTREYFICWPCYDDSLSAVAA